VARRVIVVDRPQSAQTELRIGHVGTPRTNPDRTRLGVLNALLGGKFTSRLNLNLRERNGFTYGVNSRFVDRRGPGPFVVAAAVGNDVAGAAAAETLAELDRVRESAVSEIELDETKSYLVGVFPYTLQTNGGLLARLADLALYALPSDHLERALAEIRSTTSEQILELAQRYLTPERATIVAVGPAAALTPQLERFGAVEVRTPA
ncbi:MAG: M16 family metallopeptidase, partial [Myxococcota bacterium]